jgi:hypothetical protein
MAHANPVNSGRNAVSRRLLYRHWEMWVAHLLVFIAAFAGVLLVGFLLEHARLGNISVRHTRLAIIVGGAVGCGVAGYLFARIRRYVVRRYLLKPSEG